MTAERRHLREGASANGDDSKCWRRTGDGIASHTVQAAADPAVTELTLHHRGPKYVFATRRPALRAATTQSRSFGATKYWCVSVQRAEVQCFSGLCCSLCALFIARSWGRRKDSPRNGRSRTVEKLLQEICQVLLT